MMKILGIETSCDETAVCVIDAHGNFGPDFTFHVLGNALFSQASLHARYGGVFPNLAKREHAKNLVPMLKVALEHADKLHIVKGQKIMPDIPHLSKLLEREPELLETLVPFAAQHLKPDIDAIAVTHGPGLEPALWVGVNFAKALSSLWDIPIVGVNHMEGHILLSMMQSPESKLSHIKKSEDVLQRLSDFAFPVLALLISGGHTELVLSKKFMHYDLIGQTRDDAAGEAFDKVARLLDLPYPGGPEISRLAAKARAENIEADFTFTRPMLHDDTFDFSFSGLKTAVRNIVEAHRQGPALTDGARPGLDEFKMQVAREFEDTVADVLVAKSLRAVDEYGINTLVVGGGVSANTYIRQCLAEALSQEGGIAKLLIPPPELATDNAIMIALAGYFHAIKKEFVDDKALIATGNLKLA